MTFIPVFSAPSLSVDYDPHQDCLFLMLQGQLDLTELQAITLEARQFLTATSYPSRCLVLDTIELASIDAVNWLVDQLLPSFHLAGVRQWAWVRTPTLRSGRLAERISERHPHLPLTVFDDLEHAVTWLQRAKQKTY